MLKMVIWCYNKKCYIKYGFKSLKLLSFHEKYECCKEVSEIKYYPNECEKCKNVYTSLNRLLKHQKKCRIKKINNIKQ